MPDLAIDGGFYIKYATKNVVAFVVNNDLYYLKTGPNIPQLFDASLSPMVIPNLDSWVQAKTQQRHSYRSLCDMGAAFYAGLTAAYSATDLQVICDATTQSAINEITRHCWIYDYSLIYWIEILGADKMGEYLTKIGSYFASILQTQGDDVLYNNLCRMMAACKLRQPHNADICDKLIKRLGRTPQEPVYPDTQTTDKEVILRTREVIRSLLRTKYKNIADDIVTTADALQSR